MIGGKNFNRITIAYLSINSLRNTFEKSANQNKESIYILVISGNKLGNTFPNGKFKVLGYISPFCRDQNQYSSGLMLFIREDTL